MKKNLQSALLLGVMAVSAVSAHAASQWDCHNCKIYINDFAIQKGETKTVSIVVDNPDYEFTGGQFDIFFKGGVTPVLNKNGKIAMTPAQRVPGPEDGYAGSGAWQSNGCYRHLFYNNDGMYVEGEAGPIFTFKVTTDETFGTTAERPAIVFDGELKLTDIADTSHGHLLDPSTTNVYESTSFADVLNSEGKELYLADAVKVIAKTSNAVGGKYFAFVTDGNNNWMKLALNEADQDKFVVGNTYAGSQLGGVVSNCSVNPVITVEKALGNKAATTPVTADATEVNMTQKLSLKANEVVNVTGYFFNDDSQETLRAYSGGTGERGQSLSLNFNWVGNESLQNGAPYKVENGVIQLKAAWETTSAPALVAPSDENSFQNYVLFPLASLGIATAIDDVNANSGISSVRYFNVAGVESATPFDGVNIVVTTHNDGSITTAKVIK